MRKRRTGKQAVAVAPTRRAARRKRRTSNQEEPTVQLPSGAAPKPYLEAHLDYLNTEVEKYSDPEVIGRLKARIKATKQAIKAGK